MVGLTVSGDNGDDIVNMRGSNFGAAVVLTGLNDGNNSVEFGAGSMVASFEFLGGVGNDSLVIDNSTISVSVSVSHDEGADLLEIIGVDPATQWPSSLLGAIAIDGGTGVDTASLSALVLGALNFELIV